MASSNRGKKKEFCGKSWFHETGTCRTTGSTFVNDFALQINFRCYSNVDCPGKRVFVRQDTPRNQMSMLKYKSYTLTKCHCPVDCINVIIALFEYPYYTAGQKTLQQQILSNPNTVRETFRRLTASIEILQYRTSVHCTIP